ncbi:ATP-binding protein [Pyrococcus abyssi]|uniref:DEXX-box atpase n=1 Tax=Pyrococcus abyssi (strain GE5 / Orsay) TaxID=272844 RepID=Q9UYI1_PYRAB|nr:ATP-binding protein [Pyrococcus abyssi]CAB50431.1 Hypothetical protein, contains ATP/GTP-binding site [Pyrococcus abyssi GE5]CCE70980.1 TPA: DEXX-box atpase [Pyrococcus abyssi GE5]
MIEQFNPWWKGKEFISEDEDYRKWEESGVKWVPRVIEDISLEPFSLNFIFGPRQVGKTTLLKLIIKRLLDSGVNPKAIFYLRCDYLSDYRELMNALEEYMELREIEGIENSYIFLDEITFPREWFRAIKLYVDMGKFKNDVLILTGSVSMYLKGEIETFPGRRGKGKEIIMYPLSFRDFVGVVAPELYRKIPVVREISKVRECLKLLPWKDELHRLFLLYLRSGGFPRAIKDVLGKGRVSGDTYDTYLSWVRGDIIKFGKSEEVARMIMKTILDKVPSPIGWNTIAREIDIGSHKTVFSYIEFLEKSFILKVLHYFDPNTLEPDFRKEKKVHLIDPFLYELFSRWCLVEKPSEDKIVESVVASHLARKYEVGYWRNGKEVDVVTKSGIGFEVKWKGKVTPSRLRVGKIKEVITLSKDDISTDPLMIPVPIFLACLEV